MCQLMWNWFGCLQRPYMPIVLAHQLAGLAAMETNKWPNLSLSPHKSRTKERIVWRVQNYWRFYGENYHTEHLTFDRTISLRVLKTITPGLDNMKKDKVTYLERDENCVEGYSMPNHFQTLICCIFNVDKSDLGHCAWWPWSSRVQQLNPEAD